MNYPDIQQPEKQKRISALREWWVCTAEYAEIMKSDRKNMLVSLCFPVIAAVIVVWIAGENMFVDYEGTKSGSFVLVSSAIWGGLFNSISVVVREREIVKRGYASGMRFGCYTLSRAVLQLLLCLVQSAILLTGLAGVKLCRGNDLPEHGILWDRTFLEYYVSLFLLMLAADMMGLMISCFVKKEETASVLAPYILIVQLIFSGILFPMSGSAEKLSYGMLSRWGMEAMGSISDLNSMSMKLELAGFMVPHEAEDMFLHESQHLLEVWGILAGFCVVFLVVGDLVLHGVSKDTR